MLGSGDEGSDSFAFILCKEVDDTEEGGVKGGAGALNVGALEVEKTASVWASSFEIWCSSGPMRSRISFSRLVGMVERELSVWYSWLLFQDGEVGRCLLMIFHWSA